MDDKWDVEEIILAVASLFDGKTEDQICEELKITPLTFGYWIEKYGDIACKYSWLVRENDRLRKTLALLYK